MSLESGRQSAGTASIASAFVRNPTETSRNSGAVSDFGAGPIFLAVGGIEERKNTIRILDAFAQIAAMRPDAELVIAGGATLLNHDSYQRAFSRRLAEAGSLGQIRPAYGRDP